MTLNDLRAKIADQILFSIGGKLVEGEKKLSEFKLGSNGVVEIDIEFGEGKERKREKRRKRKEMIPRIDPQSREECH